MGWFSRIRSRFSGKPRRPAGLLGRLRRDERGATLAMIAAVTIPLIGMVGGAVDMSRAYLVKVRLQQACDAGVLAARRTMTGATLDQAAKDQGTNFFNINLAQKAYGATNIGITLTDAPGGDGVVHGDATATVPTTLMRVFGQPAIAMTAQCEAQLNIANNDIMFVLDVTGSMSCLPSDSGSTCDSYAATNVHQAASGKYYTTEKANSRIDGLRDAVSSFFKTIKAATTATARLRVGFVPYSSGVNVGSLLQTNVTGSMSQAAIYYDSRKAFFNNPVYVANTPTVVNTQQTYGSPTNITQTNCNSYAANSAFTGFTPSPSGNNLNGGGPAPTATTVTTYSWVSWTLKSGSGASALGTCVRNRAVQTTTYTTRYGFTSWTYDLEQYNPTNYLTAAGATLFDPTTGTVASSGSWNAQQLVTLAGASGFSTLTSKWDGCVEERISGNSDIDNAPTGETTRFRPAWPDIFFGRTSAGVADSGIANPSPYPDVGVSGQYFDPTFTKALPVYSCPKAAQELAEIDQTAVDGYVNAADFVPHGQTYHDIGMLWAARMMSTTGMFKTIVNDPPLNGKAVNRHIIFMTDGAMEPSMYAYGTYGVERLDARIGGANQTTAHNTRFLAFCQAAKDAGNTVWVVSFAQALTPELSTCAQDSDHAFQASDTATLIQDFQAIAQKIAELRLSK